MSHLYGLSIDEFYINYSAVDVPDHSFRAEQAIALLKKSLRQITGLNVAKVFAYGKKGLEEFRGV